MNRQISFMVSFVVGLIFMIMPGVMIPKIHHFLLYDILDKFTIVFKIMTLLGFLSVIVFGLALLFEGIKNIIKVVVSLTDPNR